jgi:hypothetical protein
MLLEMTRFSQTRKFFFGGMEELTAMSAGGFSPPDQTPSIQMQMCTTQTFNMCTI